MDLLTYLLTCQLKFRLQQKLAVKHCVWFNLYVSVHKVAFVVQIVDGLRDRLEYFNTCFQWSVLPVLVKPVLQGSGLAQLHSDVQANNVISLPSTGM